MRIDRVIREMNPPRYTTAAAAKLVGRSVDTLQRWRSNGTYVPSDVRQFGALTVPLYTADDIGAMKSLAKTIKPGRKPEA